jgi:hypothetical protein
MGVLTLTSLIPTIYEALDTVSREQTGFIRSVTIDAMAARAAVNQTVMSPVVGPMAAENLNVGNVPADTPNQTIQNVPVTVTKSRSVPFGITGEENRGLNSAGTTQRINQDRIAQAIRTLANEVEADLGALHVGASRAIGTAAGTPFGTAGVLTDMANARQMMEENGAPLSDLRMVLGSTSANRLRGVQSSLFRVNEAGTDELLRSGTIGNLMGFGIAWSPQVRAAVPVGNGSAYTSSNAVLSVGQTQIPVITGTNAILAGDIITFANDPNQYVVAAGVTGPGTITIAEPGLRVGQAAGTRALTIIAATTRNMFFHRGAIVLAARAPAMPDGGDMADDVLNITDPVSGITFEFCVYRQKRQIRWEVNLAWGVAVVQPRHIGLLIGA